MAAWEGRAAAWCYSAFDRLLATSESTFRYTAVVQGMSWTTVRYMVGEVQYGGRVTDDYDKRLLNTYAKVWFSDDVFADDFQFHQGKLRSV